MSSKAHFSPEVFDFLKQLKRNNKREWFLRNKPRYDSIIKEPCIQFISDLAEPMHQISEHIAVDARSSMFRIYRDIRFSADKKPYKTHVGLQFHIHRDAKNIHSPSFYLHLEPGQCFVAAGSWHPDSSALLKIREAIVARPDAWKKAVRGLDLVGDTLSRPPRGFAPTHPLIEDLKRKDFMAEVELDEKQVCSQKFANEFVKACNKMSPLVEFLAKGLGTKW
jgi:uncharacterized protein (TIGR02453 family)